MTIPARKIDFIGRPNGICLTGQHQVTRAVTHADGRASPIHSKPDVSPAPRRTISGSGWEKSITVVGSVPQSPESITYAWASPATTFTRRPGDRTARRHRPAGEQRIVFGAVDVAAGVNLVPCWRTMMLPAVTASPPYTLMPSRCAVSNRARCGPSLDPFYVPCSAPRMQSPPVAHGWADIHTGTAAGINRPSAAP